MEIAACHRTEYREKKRGGGGNEDSLKHLWDNIKCTNICIIGVPEREEIKDLRKYLKR